MQCKFLSTGKNKMKCKFCDMPINRDNNYHSDEFCCKGCKNDYEEKKRKELEEYEEKRKKKKALAEQGYLHEKMTRERMRSLRDASQRTKQQVLQHSKARRFDHER
jgi:hypothetical protein